MEIIYLSNISSSSLSQTLNMNRAGSHVKAWKIVIWIVNGN